jgi:hypothetical protein
MDCRREGFRDRAGSGKFPRMRVSAVLVWAALACACQRGESDAGDPKAAPAPAKTAPPADPAAYARDVDRICNVFERAGAGEPGVNPEVATGDWLIENLETLQARQLLPKINSLPDSERATAYDAEARKVGLASCPTARAWDKAKIQ